MKATTETILEDVLHEPLSRCLRRASQFAENSDAKEFDRWLRLELGGYIASNPAMGEDITVPAYRGVVGQHADIFGRVLLLPGNLSFVDETRLRNGVEELESLATSRKTVTIHDPTMCEFIREHLGVEAYFYRFDAIHLTGILSAIRSELQARLLRLVPHRPLEAVSDIHTEEILELRPNLYGMGVNLRALWRRWKGTK